MSQIELTGSFVAGPPTVTDGTFPASTMSVPLGTKSPLKSYQRATGILQRTFATSGFVVLAEPGDTVTQANFMYFRSDGPLSLRLTTDDGAGGDEVATIPIDGLVIIEFETTKFLKQLEVDGNATAEYFLSGDA